MKGRLLWSVLALAIVAGLTNGLQAQDTVPMVVQPMVLNLESFSTCVTIHAEVPFNLVDQESVVVTVNGENLTPTSMKPDLRGELVIKFAAADVKQALANLDLKLPATVTFRLEGATSVGAFAGEDDVLVIKRRFRK